MKKLREAVAPHVAHQNRQAHTDRSMVGAQLLQAVGKAEQQIDHVLEHPEHYTDAPNLFHKTDHSISFHFNINFNDNRAILYVGTSPFDLGEFPLENMRDFEKSLSSRYSESGWRTTINRDRSGFSFNLIHRLN